MLSLQKNGNQIKRWLTLKAHRAGLERWLKGGAMFAAKADTLNLIPKTHVVEIETRLPKVVLQPSHTPTHGHAE